MLDPFYKLVLGPFVAYVQKDLLVEPHYQLQVALADYASDLPDRDFMVTFSLVP